MMICHYFAVLSLFHYFSTCCSILVHGPSNSSHANGITSHESSTDYSSIQQKFEQEVTELQNTVAKLSAKISAVEQNHTELEKENLDLKTLVNHLNRSFTLQQYESRMLTIQLASMESDLRALNNVSNKTNNDVSNLSNITLDIKHTLGKNNEQDKNSTGRLIEIERLMSYLKAQLRSSAVSFIDMERRAEEINSSMMLLNTTLLNFQKESSVKVAFTAGMPSSSSTFSGGTLVFPSVITNIGSGYNPSTGIFSAPNDGLYVFYVSGVEYSTKYLTLDIVLNGISKVRLIGASEGAYQTGTNMVVLNLQQGDRVWVKHTYGAGYHSESVPITTFSGFQI